MKDYSSKWQESYFYSKDCITLGIDIGIEGIGLAVRKGLEIIYHQTIIPTETKSLATRRAYRAARHVKKNRRTRMYRLKKLFQKHALTWVNDDVMSRSDPFKLRYRAINSTLASREALSICIRSIVQHRGFDYLAMTTSEEGSYPWGNSTEFDEATKWVRTSFIDTELLTYLEACTTSLTNKDKPIDEKKENEWRELIHLRHSNAEHESIPAMLQAYKGHNQYDRKARGNNYPRNHVEQHLRTIITRHSHLFDDPQGFLNNLFLPCDCKEHKKHAIFHFNRKTPTEAKLHFEKKVKKCPFSRILDLPQEACGINKNRDIIMWKMLDFLSNRNFDLKHAKTKLVTRQVLPEAVVKSLWESLSTHKHGWKDAKSRYTKALKEEQLAIAKSEWNTEMSAQLKDIYSPSKKINGRASFGATSARELCRLMTDDFSNFSPRSIESWKKEFKLYEKRAQLENTGGIYPQVRCLLGTLRSTSSPKAINSPFASKGFLQQLFESKLKHLLPVGKTTPDYCVIECIKDPAINDKQRKEIEEQQKKNRARTEKAAARYGKSLEEMTRSVRYRIFLFEEQGGSPTSDAICPFTGQSLGRDPLNPKLELAHIYPDSKGGLYLAENLVLTHRETNDAMGDNTPKEAAAMGLPHWLTWQAIAEQSKRFTWGKRKRYFFNFEKSEKESFPDFNNMTRIAQLARELRRLAATWMGIQHDPEQMRQRIGNPCGSYTSAARASMLHPDFRKDRSNHLHHFIDAAVLSCIPPAEGINDARYGGIFKSVKVENQRRLRCIPNLPLPCFDKILEQHQDSCPIHKLRSQSKCQSLGDSTFWSVNKQYKCFQHQSIFDIKKIDSNTLHQALSDLNLRKEQTPNSKKIEKWIDDRTKALEDDVIVDTALKLANGAVLKKVKKSGSKGHLDGSPLGWSGIITPEGKFDQMRKLSTTNDRLELWLGWDSKKKTWAYYKRPIPTKECLLGLKRLGIPWRGRKNAPPYLIEILDASLNPDPKKRKVYSDLKSKICGTLPPHAVKVGSFRKGDSFVLTFAIDDKENKKDKLKHHLEDTITEIRGWGEVTAIISIGKLEFKSITHKNTKTSTLADTEKLANLLGLPPANEEAINRQLKEPT